MTDDPRETPHMPCNCAPALGPEHCHQCGSEQNREVPWEECQGPYRDDQIETGEANGDELVILRVKGTQFRCHCGATVFRKVSPDLYECNACDEIYEGDSDDH